MKKNQTEYIEKMTKQELFLYLNDRYRMGFYMGKHEELILIAKFLDSDYERSGLKRRQSFSTLH
tara:strand:- start:431 stop:622 length:192 start_codon:yes stop_codon:yes gene_type:complete